VRIAALYDIHGNLPALEAVLEEVEAEAPDLVVVGGDVVSGPSPGETLERLRGLALPVRWVMGNADRLVAAGETSHPDDARAVAALSGEQRAFLAGFEKTVSAGGVLFCHGSPRSDEEIITSLTPPERLQPMLDGVTERLVVGGHTHHQFRHGRYVNAGSVGMPYEDEPGAFWLTVEDGEPRHRRTAYAGATVLATADEAARAFEARVGRD
jgi:putative phosphoesterase